MYRRSVRIVDEILVCVFNQTNWGSGNSLFHFSTSITINPNNQNTQNMQFPYFVSWPDSPFGLLLQDLLRKSLHQKRGGFSVMFVVIVGLLSALIGYMLKKKT